MNTSKYLAVLRAIYEAKYELGALTILNYNITTTYKLRDNVEWN